MGQAALPQQRRQRCKEPVHRRRCRSSVQQGLQLLVERPGALRERDELRDVCQLAVVFGVLEPAGELFGQGAYVHTEDGDEAPRE